MENIDMLIQHKNYTVVRDNQTNIVWLYSYKKPIACFDMKEFRLNTNLATTETNKKHYGNFRQWIKENFV